LRGSICSADQKLSSPIRCWSACKRCTCDRPVSRPHHHRFRSAHERPLMARLCRRRRRGADGQKLGAAPAYAN
jgi:hypothetical protein